MIKNHSYYIYNFKENLGEFIADLIKELEKIPEEARQHASISLESEYDSASAVVWISYSCEETPEEVLQREEQLRKNNEAIKERELRNLRALLSKYPNEIRQEG